MSGMWIWRGDGIYVCEGDELQCVSCACIGPCLVVLKAWSVCIIAQAVQGGLLAGQRIPYMRIFGLTVCDGSIYAVNFTIPTLWFS